MNSNSDKESESDGTKSLMPVIHLRLYITGASPNSSRAIENTKSFCEKYLTGRYELEIIDVYQQPEIAKYEQIIALPLLICKSPLPEKRMIGDMSDAARIIKCLDL